MKATETIAGTACLILGFLIIGNEIYTKSRFVPHTVINESWSGIHDVHVWHRTFTAKEMQDMFERHILPPGEVKGPDYLKATEYIESLEPGQTWTSKVHTITWGTNYDHGKNMSMDKTLK